jgi:hypothetical protein
LSSDKNPPRGSLSLFVVVVSAVDFFSFVTEAKVNDKVTKAEMPRNTMILVFIIMDVYDQ